MEKLINVARSSMPEFQEYCEEIRELWDSHWLTNMGVKHKQLQANLEQYLHVPHVILYTNGHLALERVFSTRACLKNKNCTKYMFYLPFSC